MDSTNPYSLSYNFVDLLKIVNKIVSFVNPVLMRVLNALKLQISVKTHLESAKKERNGQSEMILSS